MTSGEGTLGGGVRDERGPADQGPAGQVAAAQGPIEKGTELPVRHFPVARADLVRYAGASRDFNPIHWNERVAKDVGLPDVIAHGMLTMALAGRLVSDWAGDPGAVVHLGVRFTRPVVVPDDDEGAVVEVSGKVASVNEDGAVKVNITARSEGRGVLGGATATVRVPG